MMHTRSVALAAMVTVGCWSPKTTGPLSMIGVIVDASGEPMPGVEVNTVEARWITDAEGRFAVNYKEPSQFLTFTVQGVRLKRAYHPSDDGTEVRIQVPPLVSGSLACDAEQSCDATLTYTLDDHLTATVPVRCDRDEPHIVGALLPDLPSEATCRTGPTDPDLPLAVRRTRDGLELTPPPVDLAIAMATEEEDKPALCKVDVDGSPAVLGDDGLFHVQVFGAFEVHADCDGIPATPFRGYIRAPGEIEVVWQRATPTLDLAPISPWAKTLTIMKFDGRGAGWTLALPVTDGGTVVLPPLDAGTYVLGANMRRDRVQQTKPAADIPPNALHYRVLDEGLWMDGTPEATGVIAVQGQLDAGPLDVFTYGNTP